MAPLHDPHELADDMDISILEAHVSNVNVGDWVVESMWLPGDTCDRGLILKSFNAGLRACGKPGLQLSGIACRFWCKLHRLRHLHFRGSCDPCDCNVCVGCPLA